MDRRSVLKSTLLCGVYAAVLPGCWKNSEAHLNWGAGFEGQRKADRGDGTYLNPVLSGDHPDPSIIKDGDVYYMTFSSFDAYPGIVIWKSYDLVNWTPVTAALTSYIGSVWAPDMIKYKEKYYVFIPARTDNYKSNYVIVADNIEGPWSEPIDLKLPDHIDPGHIVGEDGKRYLFLSGGDMVQLSDDGTRTIGDIHHVYDPWQYPEEWDVECFCPEGPKMLKKGDWFYMLTAVGGTAGPPTGHMVIAARSKSVFGPWEHAPNNPQVRTKARSEAWWSRGHATLIEGPKKGDWYLMYHGYENGYWTLGRQCLLDKVRWLENGWFEAIGGDLSRPLPLPKGGKAVKHGLRLSDDFTSDTLGHQWSFYKPGRNEYDRVRLEDGALMLKASGTQPSDTSPLCFVTGDLKYGFEVEIKRSPGSRAGILLFYSDALYCGLAFDDDGIVMHRYGMERRRSDIPPNIDHLFLRCTNVDHVVTFYYSIDGDIWQKFDVQMETSGYHHNVGYFFLSLRPAIYVAGEGEAQFKNLHYTGQYKMA